jgi:hypothetical protein
MDAPDFDPSDFTKPEGDLPPNRFPEVELPFYLEKWIERAEKKVSRWLTSTDYNDDPPDRDYTSVVDPVTPRRRERAVEAFVYWKAWSHVYERLTGSAKEEQTETWSASMSDAQIDSYRKRAEDARNRFEDLVTGDDTLRGERPRSVSTETNIIP